MVRVLIKKYIEVWLAHSYILLLVNLILCLVYVYVLDISLILKRHILKQWKWFLDTLITLLITVYFIQNQAHLL